MSSPDTSSDGSATAPAPYPQLCQGPPGPGMVIGLGGISPLMLPALLCGPTASNILQDAGAGGEEVWNNGCFGTTRVAVGEKLGAHMAMTPGQKADPLLEQALAARPAAWRPPRESESSEASDADFCVGKLGSGRHHGACDVFARAEPELLAAYEEMLKSEDIPLNMDELCSTMGADSAPSNFSSGFLLPERACAGAVLPVTASRRAMAATSAPTNLSCGVLLPDLAIRPATARRQEPSGPLCMALSAASREDSRCPHGTHRLELPAGTHCTWRLGRPTTPEPEGPFNRKFLMKREALPCMTGMIPVPMADRPGVPGPRTRDMLQSASSSQECYSAEEAALLDSMATGDFAMSLISGQHGRVGFGMVRFVAWGVIILLVGDDEQSGARRRGGGGGKANGGYGSVPAARRTGRKGGEYNHITQAMLKEGGFFDMPIQEAAVNLGIGLSVLKRVCRTIGLARWPYRKRQSLRNVIEQTKLYLKDLDPESKVNVLQALEEAAAALNGSAGEDLGDAFKRYRQAVFKLNYKLNKLNTGKKCAKGTMTGKCKVAIPRSAAASLEALIKYHLPGPPLPPARPRPPLPPAQQGNPLGPVALGSVPPPMVGGGPAPPGLRLTNLPQFPFMPDFPQSFDLPPLDDAITQEEMTALGF